MNITMFIVCRIVALLLKIYVIYSTFFQENVASAINQDPDSDYDYKDLTPQIDLYSYVALIQVKFKDGGARKCSGTIIHENVVITAAHCFYKEDNSNVLPELGLSFIVIGTKRMYSSGYENYVPIDRVRIHPKYCGWAYDIALVFAYADLSKDKSGKIVTFGGDRSGAEANVTVLSWYSKNLLDTSTKTTIDSSEESLETTKPKHRKTTKKHYRNYVDTQQRAWKNDSELRTTRDYERSIYIRRRNGPSKRMDADINQEHLLRIEPFSFVNLKECKKIIEEGSLEKYYNTIKDTKDFLCYSSDTSYNAGDVSGAPALRKEHLLAVTVGAVKFENEHVAVGMKISCFCPWIKENLPSGKENIQCCRNCCGWIDPPETGLEPTETTEPPLPISIQIG